MATDKQRGLEHLRKKLNETQVETAEALGINYKAYNHYERRRRRQPRDAGLLIRMAEHFGVSVEEIIWHLGADEGETQSSSQATSTA